MKSLSVDSAYGVMRFISLGLGIVFACVISVAALGQDNPPASTVDGVQRVSVTGGSYHFEPSKIVVKINIPVELSLNSAPGLIPHTFVINAPQAGIVVDENLSTENKVVRFTPSALGQYPFYCKNKLMFFKSHREHGMEGVLEVVE